jgi:hypothetical protein
MPDYNENDQFSILFPVLQDYGIKLKLGIIIADNAFLNNVLYRTIEKHIWNIYKKKWLVDDWRIRCIGYIINLII